MMELSAYAFSPLREGEFTLYRGSGKGLDPILLVVPVGQFPAHESLRRIEHEYGLRAALESDWAARPVALASRNGRAALVLEDPGGEPLDRRVGRPMDVREFLRVAVSLALALHKMHRQGLIHKDVRPANVLVDMASARVRLTGFGIASRLPREHQVPEPPEVIAGTLAYMAPEQTGRMNRSIDSRSDLYALGATFYEMLTGVLPFAASDPMEWVHCHIARQPVPPDKHVKEIPAPLSAIVLKLLAKAAEERYQTAAGVAAELRRCQVEWEAHGRIDLFPLGANDVSDRLLIPEKLYGREREIEILVAAFDRIVKGGTPELVLVSGYSGIGKSSVVNELHKVLVPPRGLFAAGKFDQYKRDIPYSTLAQAFQSLVRPLLAKSDVELGYWRDALREALGPSGQLMVDLVPELKLIIGEQVSVPELPPQDAQRRFQLVFRRFLAVFARSEHPLALFLDDLQWLDAATLDLLEDLLTQRDVRHVLLIVAYRDNEVTSAHPLTRTLDRIRSAGAPVQNIVLTPLAHEHVGQLIADSLCCDRERAAPLAELVHQKTAGNPFFVIQFLSALVEEGLLSFDHGAARWSWDLAHIHAKGYTDNVVDLMVDKLSRLPISTQKALQQLACLGNSAEFAPLAMVHEDSKEELRGDLQEALRTGLVLQSEGSYRFLHDRVQEAAYSLIPETQRAEAHLRIGRLLAAYTSPEKREVAIFEIVNQLNRGAALISSRVEKDQLAEFNLIAGKRAKASTAYASALTYLTTGRELIPNDCWTVQYRLLFDLELHRAECEYLTGEPGAAENRLSALAERATNLVDRAAVARQRLALYTILARLDRAVEVGLGFLTLVGIEWSPHPTSDEIAKEYDQIWRQIEGRSIEQLVDLPLMSDPDSLAVIDVLTAVSSPAIFYDSGLGCLMIGRMINLSLAHGHTDGSLTAYVYSNLALGCRYNDYLSGFRFAKLGFELMEQHKLFRFKPRVYLGYALANSWINHLSASQTLLRRAFDTAREAGDIVFMGYALRSLVTNLLASGTPLAGTRSEAESALEFARQARFGLIFDIVSGQLALIRTLQGHTPTFGCFDDGGFDELRFEQHLRQDSRFIFAACWYWVRKLQARYYASDYVSAIDAETEAHGLLSEQPSFRFHFEAAEFHFYAALARAAHCRSAPADERAQHLEMLHAHHNQLKAWAENCPENFENRALLVGAEIDRIEGRELDAERLYEAAIKSARENGFVHNRALAAELAARFYAARGFDTIATAYMRDARHGYLQWGAAGKVRQLDERYPYLRDDDTRADPTRTLSTPVEHLDLATVLKVSQAVSGETDLDKLTATVMRLALEHAGAERGLLILPQGAAYRIEAEARIDSDAVAVDLQQVNVTAGRLPESLFHYVLRTKESVLLQDASAQGPFSDDDYMRRNRTRSVLCLPLLKQTRLVGVIYLENNLTPGAFTPARLALLELLASEAAISLENARLYRDLQEREARVRRLFNSNIIGIFTWNLDGRILDANEAFLQIIGYGSDDLSSGHMRWKDLMPAEWDEDDDQRMRELMATSIAPPFEVEYVKKDGGRVPVLVGAALFDGMPTEGVAFVLDLSDRKRAEEAARDGIRRYHEVQTRLADANRVASVGQLSASIAHELNQPLSGIITNASTCLRMLAADLPNVDGASETARRTIRDANRASEVITRLRTLFAKKETATELVDLNEAAQEVIALSSNVLRTNRVNLRSEFADDLPLVTGDRVQLQQVILNLLRNALDAMNNVDDRPRQLAIRTERDEGDQVRLTVQDTGVGLNPQGMDKLFEAFYTTKRDGMGIGLSLSRSIIESHHGRIWAAPNDGPGATFSFCIPCGPESGVGAPVLAPLRRRL